MRLGFKDCVFDGDTREFLRGGAAVHLPVKTFRLLELLLESRPKAMPKEKLMETLWPGVFVAEGNLARLVAELREAIGDDAHEPRFIRTIHGFGYAFAGEAAPPASFPEPQAADVVIKEEPEPIEKSKAQVPLPLQDPAARYPSTRDLAQDLKDARDRLTEKPAPSAGGVAAVALRRYRVATVLAAAVGGAGLIAVLLMERRAGNRPMPDFQRLTYRRGTIASARFAADGRTIIYGAAWDGAPIRVFSMRTDGRDSTRLELPDADLLSISPTDEIAILLARPITPIPRWVGTLARVPLSGGAPRELAEAVATADWSPDGSSLAIVRHVGTTHRLEFPIGKALYETKGWIEYLRISPAGDRIALLVRGADQGATVSVETVDLAGKHDILSRGWKRGSGLAWSPDGREVWFGANERELRTPVYAVTLSGKLRLLLRLPTWIDLEDVSRDGRILAAFATIRSRIQAKAPGETEEKDLSWHDVSMVKSLTSDGKTLLFDEANEGYFHTVYVRPTDGSPAKRLGEGRALAISPDGHWVAANVGGRGGQTVLMPTGAGEPRLLNGHGHRFEEAEFFPDGKRILLLAVDPGHGNRSYVADLQTGDVRPITPEGFSCRVLSPDVKEAACTGPKGEGVIYSLEEDKSRPIPGFQARSEDPLQWSSDGRSLYVGPASLLTRPRGSPKVFRLDLATGRREFWREFRAPNEAAPLAPFLYNFAITPDGQSYAYSFLTGPSELYLVTGFK